MFWPVDWNRSGPRTNLYPRYVNFCVKEGSKNSGVGSAGCVVLGVCSLLAVVLLKCFHLTISQRVKLHRGCDHNTCTDTFLF